MEGLLKVSTSSRMQGNKLKSAYLQARKTVVKIDPERQHLGMRELQTLKLLASEVGYKANFGAVLLDLGCADCFIESSCIKEGWDYIGLDYNDVDFERSTLSLDANSVDIVVSLAVIEHLRDPENFLTEIFRCLKPGGLVYLSTPNFQLDWKNFYNDPTHVRPYTPTSLEELLRLFGFVSLATFPGIRCKGIGWYRGKNRFLKAYLLLPFRNDTWFPAPNFLKGHARSFFALGRKPLE